MIEDITKLRIGIDGISRLLKELKEDKGQGLEVLTKYPFNSPESNNDGDRKGKKDIEKTADITNMDSTPEFNNEWNIKIYIEKIDWLREEIIKAVSSNLQYTKEHEPGFFSKIMGKEKVPEDIQGNYSGWIGIYSLRVDQYLCEARFWLEFELQRLRKSE